MVTIKDIAAAAGVSATTVSNVIHGYNGRVSPETAEHIRNIIDQMGYIPNLSARSLVSRSSHMIAFIRVLSPMEERSVVVDPVRYRIMAQLETAIQTTGYYLMVRTCRTAKELIAFLQNWNVDGLFVNGPVDDEIRDALEEIDLPVVLIDSHADSDRISVFCQDDFEGGRLAAQDLIAHGHRRIGFACIPWELSSLSRIRYEGFREALREADIPFDDAFFFPLTVNDADDCLAASESIIPAMEKGMTALCVSHDQLAIGIQCGLRQKGYDLPAQLSMVGFGDMIQIQLMYPRLSSISCDMDRMTELALRCMFDTLTGKQAQPMHITLPVALDERESVASV